MRAEPIARYLVRFDRDESAPAPPSFMIMPEPTIDPAEIIAVEREAAHAEGYEAGLAAAREEAATAQQKAEAEFDARLQSERTRWTEVEAERMTVALAEGFDVLTRNIAHCAEQVLRPFLDIAMRQKAMADLADTLMRLGEDAPLIRISGPVDLLDALHAAEALPNRSLDLEVGADVDVKVIAQPTLIETRIGAWVRRLQDIGEQAVGV